MKKILIIFLVLMLNQPVFAVTLFNKIKLPNTKSITYNKNSSERLNEKFVEILMTNQQIQNILIEMAKDQKAQLIPFLYIKSKGIKFLKYTEPELKQKIKNKFKQTALIDGYYFYIVYKSNKKDDIINVTLNLSEIVLDKASPISGAISSVLMPFLKNLFKVSKYHQLKKFNERYFLINQILTENIMQSYQKDIINNLDDYGVKTIKIYTDELIIEKTNDKIEIHAKKVIIK